MKTLLITVALACAVCGCVSSSLVERMRHHGVTDLNTGKIVLHGSEADVGSGVRVEIVEHLLIQRIWDSIYQSRLTKVWYSSGYRQAEFYADTDLNNPACTLWINESDACNLSDATIRFRCPHLNGLALDLLQKAKEGNRKGDPSAAPDDLDTNAVIRAFQVQAMTIASAQSNTHWRSFLAGKIQDAHNLYARQTTVSNCIHQMDSTLSAIERQTLILKDQTPDLNYGGACWLVESGGGLDNEVSGCIDSRSHQLILFWIRPEG